MRHLSILAALFTFSMPAMAQPTWQAPPKLVVGIVVDQMRTDHIYRYWNNYGDNGFKRLVNEGSFLRDAHFNYMPTYTGPGHTSIYTGTTPAHHGIVGNDMYDRNSGRKFYCALDENARAVGSEQHPGLRSPLNLLATTLADELERFTGREARTIGISWKDRGSILPIGRTGDAAYWFGAGTEGHWITSSWYMGQLPKWVEEFNALDLPAKYLQRTWELLLPRDKYLQVLPDDNPYEIPLPGADAAKLPLDLAALFEAGGRNTGLLGYTPWGNTLTTDFALAAVAGEQLGQDGITDLLAISYSSPDLLGHRVGIRALEMEDMYLRLDRDLARLLDGLDKRVGKGQYTVFLTSDHGAADVPAYMRDLKGSAGYAEVQRLRTDLEIGMGKRLGTGNWVRTIINEQVFLNDSLIAVRKLEPALVQRIAADVLLTFPVVAEALTASDLVRSDFHSPVRANVQRGFMPQRSGDVCFVLRPGHFDHEGWASGRGTTHGSPWNYDTHIPILFFGKGVRSGEVLRRTHITDIAPTISMLLGMPMPDAATGVVVPEVIAPRDR